MIRRFRCQPSSGNPAAVTLEFTWDPETGEIGGPGAPLILERIAWGAVQLHPMSSAPWKLGRDPLRSWRDMAAIVGSEWQLPEEIAPHYPYLPAETASGDTEGPRTFVRVLSDVVHVDGQSIGTTLEGPTGDGRARRIDSRPASGGRSYSRVDEAGAFLAKLTEPLDRGTAIEDAAVAVLLELLRARGDDVELEEGEVEDHRGEDRMACLNDRHGVVLQVVTLPAEPLLWKELRARGTATTTGTMRDAVELVRGALLHKQHKASGAILVLAAAHLGAIVGSSLVAEYLAAYGDPEQEFQFAEVWIIGPTVRSSVRLVGPARS